MNRRDLDVQKFYEIISLSTLIYLNGNYFHVKSPKVKKGSLCIPLTYHTTARQNGFEYKVKTQANDYQNLKVDTLRVQNNRKLKSYDFFLVNFCLSALGLELTTP